MQDDAKKSKDALWDLLWRVRLSGLYHLKRERFLDGIEKAAKGVSALGGAAAFSQFKADPGTLGLWITALITVVSTSSLVYGPSAKARKHSELARDLKRLESEIVGAGSDLTLEQICKFDAKFLNIESAEPAGLGALVTQCHNELSVAIGQRDQVTRLPLIQRAFKNWFDFDQSLGMHVEPSIGIQPSANRRSGFMLGVLISIGLVLSGVIAKGYGWL